MSRKYVVIGLLMVVFAFPATESYVLAKSCKKQKSDLRSRYKENIKSICVNEILPRLDKILPKWKNLYNLNEQDEAIFCRSRMELGDWSVKTNPTGTCGQQKDHIRKKYGNKLERLELFLNGHGAGGLVRCIDQTIQDFGWKLANDYAGEAWGPRADGGHWVGLGRCHYRKD